MNYYSLVSVLVDGEGIPKKLKENVADSESYMIFVENHLLSRISRAHTTEEILNNDFETLGHSDFQLRTFMLGDLIYTLRDTSKAQSIKVNPVLYKSENLDGPVYLCEECFICPSV